MEYTHHYQGQPIFQYSIHRHSALAQYFRWFQIYERPFTDKRIQNQIEIFHENIIVESISNTAKGALEYKDKLKGFDGTKNAHHVQDIEVKPINENLLQLTADIIYQGIRNNDQPVNSRIHYQTTLSSQKNELPLFTNIKLSHRGEATPQSYKDAYPRNRATSLMHYWLYLIETARGNASVFRELLADDFQLNLSSKNTINTWDQFETWITSVNTSIIASAHFEKNLSATENADGSITMTV